MDLSVSLDCKNVDWERIPELLQAVGMGFHMPEMHRIAFENSHTVVFIYDGDELVGFGRAISDGVYQAAVYDCAVKPDYQGRGVGRLIMTHILEGVSNCNVILYAAPGKEGFYEKHEFRRMKTGMALFLDPERKKENGFTY